MGIVGGGQLALMLAPQLQKLGALVWVLDQPGAPAEAVADRFFSGDLESYEDVLAFGGGCDRITIEIEKANAKALSELESRGKVLRPQASLVALIQDKGLQKNFFREKGIPTADFILTDSRDPVEAHLDFLPAAQKLRTGGYDGKGVRILRSEADLANAFQAPSVLERKVDLACEVAVIVARGASGESRSFDPVGMVFDPELNLLDHLIAPAELNAETLSAVRGLAEKTASAFGIVGLLAVEMFIAKTGEILVNEVAPRPHNSGHHTIEACRVSQYEELARVLLDLPLGDSSATVATALLFNLLGEPRHAGPAMLLGRKEAEKIPGVYVHDYGKIETKPGRKMGHVTILGANPKELRAKLARVRALVKFVAKGTP